MKMKYSTAMKSIQGTREEQEDCAYKYINGQEVVAVVCDGMGGHDSGKLASNLTIQKFRELYEKKDPSEPFAEFYMNTVDILDELVYHLKNEEGTRAGAGTTFVAATVKGEDLSWLSVGDSRLYILRDNELVQATRDHNYFLRLNQMKHENEISERQYNSEAAKGEALISFIGIGGIEIMDINHSPFKLRADDTVLLSTDGLFKALSDSEIKQCLHIEDTEEALSALINKVEAKALRHQDNTTCILIKCSHGR